MIDHSLPSDLPAGRMAHPDPTRDCFRCLATPTATLSESIRRDRTGPAPEGIGHVTRPGDWPPARGAGRQLGDGPRPRPAGLRGHSVDGPREGILEGNLPGPPRIGGGPMSPDGTIPKDRGTGEGRGF